MSASVQMRVDLFGGDGVPHTFLHIIHPDGSEADYGLVPENGHLSDDGLIDVIPIPPGSEGHEYNFSSKARELSDNQYTSLMKYINESIKTPPKYFLPGDWWPNGEFNKNNCTGWAVEAWQAAGLSNDLGVTNNWAWNPYGQALFIPWHNLLDYVKSLISENFKNSNTYRIVWLSADPLALDLDGDGIETTAVNGATGALFDHNNDSISTATGWLKPDDGFLVRDVNGNGVIDSGAELFGDSTLLKDGSNAANGFTALADLDTNSDGLVDASDNAFSQLRIWSDLNQDGVS